MNKYIVSASSCLLYLLPFALLTGPFLPDLFICIIGISTTFIIIKEKKIQYFKNKYFIFFILFCFYLIARSILSKSPLFSLESSLFYFRFGLFAVGVWYLIENNNKLIKYFSILFLLTFIFALLDGYYQYFNQVSLFGIEHSGVRLSLPFNDKLILGGYLARLFPLLIAVLIYSFDFKKSYIFIILLILIFTDVLIFISGERTALGLLFLSTVFIIIFLSKYKKIRFFTFMVSLVIMAILALYNPAIKERNIDYTINQISGEGSGEIKMFSNVHHNYLLLSWQMFIDKPLVGQGPKMFRILCNDIKYNINEIKDACSTHPHNTFLQLLAETGIVGLLFILIISFKLVQLIYSHSFLYIRKKEYLLSDFQICIIACFAVTLWPLIPSQNFFNNWISIIYFLPVGFYLHSIYTKNS